MTVPEAGANNADVKVVERTACVSGVTYDNKIKMLQNVY